jgi:hypothetical protein
MKVRWPGIEFESIHLRSWRVVHRPGWLRMNGQTCQGADPCAEPIAPSRRRQLAGTNSVCVERGGRFSRIAQVGGKRSRR